MNDHQQRSWQLKSYTFAELVTEHYKFEACKTFNIKAPVWLRSVASCICMQMGGFL